MRIKSSSFALLLFVTAVNLPFLNQAFHIDDRIYLEVAENILQKPLFPYDYSPVFEGLLSPDAASHSHLPLVSYYLALIKLVSGRDQEWIYHLAFLIFPLLAAVAFYDLAERYVRFPAAASVLLVIAPGFYVLSHTLMTEVPLLAFWLLTLSRFLSVVNGHARRRDWVIFTLALMAASFTSLLSIGLVLLMAAHLLLTKKQFPRPLLYVLLLPFVLWIMWYAASYFHYDRFVLVNMFKHITKRGGLSWKLIGTNALSFVLNSGGVVLFPVGLWYAFARGTSLRVFLLLFFASFVPFYVWIPQWSGIHIFLFAVFFSSGSLVTWQFVVHCCRSGSRTTPTVLLTLWFFGIFATYVFLYYSGSVRYSLLACPPVILLWIGVLQNRIEDSYFLRNLVWFGVFLTAIYSVVVGCGDYQFAEVYRRAAPELVSRVATKEDHPHPPKFWFAGEWGFRYYAEKNCAQVLPRTRVGPQRGDRIVKPYIASPWVTLYDEPTYTDLLEQRYVEINYPVRMLDFGSHAGFYSTGWGILPFSIGSRDQHWEWFNIFLVRKKYEGPIPKQEQHW